VARSLDLTAGWQVAQCAATDSTKAPPAGGLQWIEADVPSSVHYDLIKAGRLENPFASSAAADAAAWVCAADWAFRRSFDLGSAFFGDRGTTASEIPALEFDGVDTFADIWLNGQLVGQTSNAYRAYRFPLEAEWLKVEGNELLVHVKAHRRMIADQIPAAKAQLYTDRNPYAYAGKSLLRRYQRSFFGGASLLNLGTEILGIGLYKPIRLVTVPQVGVEDFHFQVDAVSSELATASVTVTLRRPASSADELTVTASLIDPEHDQAVASAHVSTATDQAALHLRLAHPRLWWPHGYGEAHLYRLHLEVRDQSGHGSHIECRVGIKQVELVRETDRGRRTFQFVVNGTNIWVRGQNPIPVDYIAVHGPDETYDRLLRLVVEGNGNLVRMWGGGGLENEHFFDLCDELGIMVWHDFFLNSAPYPDYDPTWVAEFREESVELVRRLRNHACLALLCGGNEQEQGWDEWGWQGDLSRFYGEPLIKDLLPRLAQEEAPEIPYVTNSPHGGRIEASPAEGDMHLWGNYINATKDPLFITETCWNLHSYSRPQTLAATMDVHLDDFAEAGWPGKWKALTKLPLITKSPYSDYFASRTLAEYLRSLEVEHLQADATALKTLRLMAPSLTGIVNWSFNKGGPLFEFGCIDYLGYPLMNFYAIKRLFADVVVGIYRDINDFRVVASNFQDQRLEGRLVLTHFDVKGTVLRTWDEPVVLEPRRSTRIGELADYYDQVIDRTREAIHAELLIEGRVVSEDTQFFVPLAEVEVVADPVTATVTGLGPDRWGTEAWAVELTSAPVQKLVQLEGNQKWLCSDNYFTLVPGRTRRVIVTLLERTCPDAPELSVSTLDVPGEQRLTLS